MTIVSTKMTNTIATNVTKNYSGKKVRDCYILHTVLLAIIYITIDNYYYFDDIVRLEDFVIDNVLIDEKSHKNILVCGISYITLIGSKSLHIRFDKIDGFIRIYDGTRYLTLFGSEKYNVIYDRIRYLISLKNGITNIFSHYFAKIKVDFYDSLPIEKILTLNNVIILIELVLDKDRNHYYYEMFLEKCLYQLGKK